MRVISLIKTEHLKMPYGRCLLKYMIKLKTCTATAGVYFVYLIEGCCTFI